MMEPIFIHIGDQYAHLIVVLVISMLVGTLISIRVKWLTLRLLKAKFQHTKMQEEIIDRYHELINAVGTRSSKETRYKTALRLIREAQKTNNDPCDPFTKPENQL